MRKHSARHIRVAHQVMRLPQQLFAGKATDGNEGVVAIGDLAVQVGGGDQSFPSGKSPFVLSNRQIAAHTGNTWLPWTKRETRDTAK